MAVAAILATAGIAVIGVSPASAHDQIIGQTPGENEHLDVAPEQITITFDANPMTVGATIRVVDAQERDWAEGDPVFDGQTVTQMLGAGMPDGNYQIRWRIVSEDGHPLSMSSNFSVGDLSSALPVASAAAPSEPTTDQSGEYSLDAVDTAGTDTTSETTRVLETAGIGAAIAGFIVLVVVIARTRSRHAASGELPTAGEEDEQ